MLHILRTPMKEIHREAKGDRWCFVCRKRVPFFFTVSATVEPSYYDNLTPEEMAQEQYWAAVYGAESEGI